MSLEGSAERIVFSACVPAVEEILIFIPQSEWLRLRYVNKFMKRVIDRKLIFVETFPWVPKKTDESVLDEAFYFVRNMTPNLKKLPPFIEDRIIFGGFTNVRRLTIRPERVLIYGLDHYIREIQNRASVLEYLELQNDGTETSRRLTNVILEGRCRFDLLREFTFSPESHNPEFLNEIYFRLRDIAPNREQLPSYCENRIHLGGFQNLRKLTIHRYTIFDEYPNIQASEIVNRASDLESLKFEHIGYEDRDGRENLIVDVFRSGCCFESLRELGMYNAEVDCPIFPADIISSLPVLEHVSFPYYSEGFGFAQDFQRVASLPKLKVLEGCADQTSEPFVPPLPPIPSLEIVSFRAIIIVSYQIQYEFDWKQFFVGSGNLRKIVTYVRSGRDLIASLNRMPSHIRELRIRFIDMDEDFFSGSKSLQSLEFLEIRPAMRSSIQKLVHAMNVNLRNLKAVKFDIPIEEDATFCKKTPTFLPFLFEIPSLNELSIRMNGWPDKPVNIRLQISETLKRNLRGFGFSVSKPGDIYFGIYQFITELLDGCVSLERITLVGWNAEEVKEFKENVAMLRLPKLNDIAVHDSL